MSKKNRAIGNSSVSNLFRSVKLIVPESQIEFSPKLFSIKKRKKPASLELTKPAKSFTPERIHFKEKRQNSRLLTKTRFDTPAVGTYLTKQQWIKHSYSNKSWVFNYSPVRSQPKIVVPSVDSCELIKKMSKRCKKRTVNTAFQKKIFIPERKKGFWEDFKIFETPENMKKSLRSDVQKLLDYHTSITETLGKLKEINLTND